MKKVVLIFLFLAFASLSSYAQTSQTGRVFPVRSFGAKCDGSTNDQTAIAAAITAATATGGTVTLPEGTCIVTGLTVPGGVTLRGNGKYATTIKSSTNAVILNLVQGSGAFAFMGPKIYDLGVDGSDSGSLQIGIQVTDATYMRDVVIEDVFISDCGSHGISFGNVFSSSFKNIYSNSHSGYPFFFNSPNMPSNYFYGLYAGDISAAAPAGYRIKQGLFICWSCNGINNVPATAYWAILGGKNGDIDGDTGAFYAQASFVDCNIEGAPTAGVLHYPGSTASYLGLTTFVGLTGSSGSWKALEYDTDASIFPENGKRGYIADTVVFSNSPASFYANSQPIHSDGNPPLSTNGRGPQIAGSNTMVGTYRNSATSRTEQLNRADGYMPVVTVTATTSFTNPGLRNLEVTCASDCTQSLPWPGWYASGSELLVVKNLSTTGIVVTLNANGGGTVNGSSYTISTTGEAVILLSDGSNDWRIVGERFNSGASPRIPYYASSNKFTTTSGLEFDTGSTVLKSPGRFWAADTSASNPSFSFTSDTDTGFYRPSANTIGITANGANVGSFGTTGLTLGVPGSVAGAAIFGNTSNSNTTTLISGAPSSSISITLPATLPASAGCLQISSTGVITQTGSACGAGGGSVTWDAITNPVGNLALSMNANTTSFTWGSSTSTANLLTLSDGASNTGTGYVFSVNTASSSAAKPIRFTAGGTANGVEMTTAGVLQAINSGEIRATMGNPSASIGLTANNGTATSAMRSDATPALSQSIAPTWTALHTFNPGTTPTTAALIDINSLGSAGTRDSNWLMMRGRSNDGSTHLTEWKQFVDVNTNAGGSLWTLESRIDAASFATRFTVSDAGAVAGGAFTGDSFTTSGGAILDDDINAVTGFTIAGAAATGQYLRGNGTRAVFSTIQSGDLPGSFSGFANPSATIGLTATNGSATTAMRSDAAPAISQSIAPTWTASHTFAATMTAREIDPQADNTYDLGTTSLRWKTVHVGPGSVVVHNDATNTLKATLGFSGSTAQLVTDGSTPLQLKTGANNGFFLNTNGTIGFNLTSATSGNLDFRQIANGDTILNLRRFTDTSPTGNAIRYQTAAGTDLFLVDTTGTMTVGTVPTARLSGSVSASNMPALTGDVTTTIGTVATTIANDAVTFAKFQNITDNRLLGRSAGSTGDMQEIVIGSGLSLSGGTLSATGGGSGTVTNTNTLTANSFVFGDGTTAIKSTAAGATNGQLLIGSTGANPVAATLSGSSSITVTNGAGSITLSIPTGGVTNAMLAGSITDDKLSQLTTPDKVADSALSTNVPLLNTTNTFTLGQNVSVDDSATTSATTLFDLRHSSTGAPGTGFGTRVRFGLESTTTTNQDAANIIASWSTATHASRTAQLLIQLVNNAGVIGTTATFAGNGNLTITGTYSGNGSSLTSLNASNLSSGTVDSTRGGAGTISGILRANGSGTVAAVTVGSGLSFDGTTLSATGGSGYATIQEEGSALTQRTTFNFVGTSFIAADDAGNSRTNVTSDSDLDALASNSTNGLWARTGSGTGAARTITGTTNQVTVSNGDGVSGNPTLSLPQSIHTAATPQFGALGLGETAPTAGLAITGQTLTTQATNTAGGLDVTSTLNKNDANTRSFSSALIHATLNAGGSNSNTTFNVLEVDTTQTSITGTTVNLLNLKSGGSSVLTVSSGGFVSASVGYQANGVSVPTISSTDTLTNKTMSGSSNTFSNIAATSLAGLNSLTTATPATDDSIPIYDTSAAANRRATVTQVVGAVTEGYINGAVLTWSSTTQVQVTTGTVHIQSSGSLMRITSTLTISPSLSTNTWYHCYVFDNAGTPSGECVTTAPASPYTGTARSNSSDTARRYVGSIRTDGSSQIRKFVMSGGGSYRTILWMLDTTASPFRVLSGGLATTNTNVDLSAVVPNVSSLIKVARIRLVNLSSAAVYVFVDNSDMSGTNPAGGAGFTGIGQNADVAISIPINSSQIIRYAYAGGTPSGSGAFIEVQGYEVEL